MGSVDLGVRENGQSIGSLVRSSENKSFYTLGVCVLLGSVVLFLGLMLKGVNSLGSGWLFSFSLGSVEFLLFDYSYPLVFDYISCSFGGAVCFISLWVILYSGFYMAHELHYRRFCYLVLLFVLSMNLLIFNPSMITLMVGWDGLGVISFLLVMYYMDSGSYSAAMLTVFSNRVGDVMFIIFISVACMGIDLEWFSLSLSVGSCGVVILGLSMVLGSLTKSAQLPFSAWLPAAMAAPTPVSALVHSSTLVTAGVYMLVRFYGVVSGPMMVFLMFASMCTFYLAALSGLAEMDVKKVVALSTLSQVSFMMLALSLGLVSLAFFHLLVHAFFKALMFMCVGCVMYSSAGAQDIRLFSKMLSKLPMVSSWLLLSFMCLCGLPFMSGFYSKDLIVEAMLGSSCSLSLSMVVLGSVVLTVGYSSRVAFLLFKEGEVGSSGVYKESVGYLVFPICGLGMAAFLGGYGLQSVLLDSKMYVELSFIFKVLTIGCLVLGLALGYFLSGVGIRKLSVSSNWSSKVLRFLSSMFFMAPLSGWWAGSRSSYILWNMVMSVEELMVTRVVWSKSFGGAADYLGSLMRRCFSKYINMLMFFVLGWGAILLVYSWVF